MSREQKTVPYKPTNKLHDPNRNTHSGFNQPIPFACKAKQFFDFQTITTNAKNYIFKGTLLILRFYIVFISGYFKNFRSKKYILTLVPIFIVCPTLGVIGFFLRHRLVSLAKRCCGKSNQQQDEKDVSKVGLPCYT